MITLKKNRPRNVTVVLASVIIMACVLGCTDETVSTTAGHPQVVPSDSEDDYSIKLLVRKGGTETLVRFGPMGERLDLLRSAPMPIESEEADSGGGDDGLGRRGLKEQVVVDDGTSSYDTNDADVQSGYAPGWTLAALAAKSCTTGQSGSGRPAVDVATTPWSGSPEINQQHLVRVTYNCDGILAAQEVLLCTADRLAEIADSPGTVLWDIYYFNEGDPDAEELLVTVPPQATRDRFIARDMALNVLAGLAQTLFRTGGGPVPGQTCTERYLEYAADPYWNSTASTMFSPLFRASGEDTETQYIEIYESDGTTPKSAEEAAEVVYGRVQLQANVIAAAARLTKKLIEDSVRDDLAGAERARAAAGDPLEGARRMWGAPNVAEPTKTPYYNSLRHALKVLFGRLELSPNRDIFGVAPVWDSHGRMIDDPECMGWAASEVMDALGPDHSARWNDTPPSTPDQAFALSLLESAGIVLPPLSGYNEQGRQAIQNQLLYLAAIREGVTFEAFNVDDNPLAEAIKAVLGGLSDEDLIFAVRRNFQAFRLLTGYPEVDTVDELFAWSPYQAALEAGLPIDPSSIHSSLIQLFGMVITGGLPRRELAGDILPRMGLARASAQCDLDLGGFSALTVEDALAPTTGWTESHQNPFALAEVFRRRLAIIRDSPTAEGQEELQSFASFAAAEISEWAGPGRVVIDTHDEVTGEGTVGRAHNDIVYITGLELKDYGVQTLAQLEQLLVRTDAAKPWVAQCLLGERQSCPGLSESAVPRVFQAPLSVTPRQGAFGIGLDGLILEVVFPPRVAFADPTLVDDGTYYPFTTYRAAQNAAPAAFDLLVRADPSTNGNRGKFLSTIRATNWDASHGYWGDGGRFNGSSEISNLQRELANQVFGMSRADRSERSCLPFSNTSTSTPKSYCLPGMERDMFVPLANELTTEGTGFEDSWRHYLRLAKDAAAKADEIGRELIDLGITREIRQEAALEEVANLCGSFPKLDGIGMSEEALGSTEEDAQTSECLNDENYDLVYISKDPFAGVEPEVADASIRYYFCPSQHVTELGLDPLPPELQDLEDAPFCSKPRSACLDDEDNCLKHAGLGFVEEAYLPTVDPASVVCRGYLDTVKDSLDASGFVSQVSAAPWAQESGLLGAIRSYQLLEKDSKNWVLLLNEGPLVGTLSEVEPLVQPEALASIYPACLASGCDEQADFMAEALGLDDHAADPNNPNLPKMLALVEEAIKGLGGLAGSIPGGTIGMNLPVVNVDNRDAFSDASLVPPAALYGISQFELSSQGDYQLSFSDAHGRESYFPGLADRAMMGGAVPLTADYLDGRDDSEFYDAAVAQQIQTDAAGYLMVSTSNAPISYQFNMIDDGIREVDQETGEPIPFTNPLTRANLPSWYELIAASSGSTLNETIHKLYLREAVHKVSVSSAEGGLCDNQELGGPAFIKRFGYPYYAVLDAVRPIGEPGFVEFMEHPFLLGTGLWGWGGSEAWDDGCMRQGPNYFVPLLGTAEPESLFSPPTGLRIGTCIWGASANEQASVQHLAYLRLAPRYCPPSERIELFLPSADNLRAVTHGLSLACVAAADGIKPELPAPPGQLQSVGDIARMEAWVGQLTDALAKFSGELYMTDVPASAVKSIKNGRVDASAVALGQRGELLLDLAEHLRGLQSNLLDASLGFEQIRGLLQAARIRIKGAGLDRDEAKLALQVASLELERERVMEKAQQSFEKIQLLLETQLIAAETVAAIGAVPAQNEVVGYGTPAAAQGAVGLAKLQLLIANFYQSQVQHRISLSYNKKISEVIDEQAENAAAQYENDVQAALADLRLQSQAVYGAISDAFAALTNSLSDGVGVLTQLKGNQRQARIAVAKASSADFVEQNGELLPLHLNTVYRRQFGVLQERYSRALDSAKRAAYLARRAIEQRLGVKFSNLHEDLGPLEAPSLWIDDVCSLQGIDYDALRTATSPDEGGATGDPEELDLIAGFADQYIGDYVQKLEELVEFYNLENPFNQAEDAAIISLREDLGNDGKTCTAQSPNLLYHSDNLIALAKESPSGSARQGWRASGCDDAKCLLVEPGLVLENEVMGETMLLEPPGGRGATNWLYNVAPEDAPPHMAISLMTEAPDNAVYQTVTLAGGTRHVLTWWDMGRTASGAPLGASSPETYRVAVYDSDWAPILLQDIAPHSGGNGTEWGERRRVEFVTPEAGDYHVAFFASTPNGDLGSVAIANIQLEDESATFETVGYHATDESRVELSGSCSSLDPKSLRERFEYVCDDIECYYELNDQLIIDTELLSAGQSPLKGQLALGNFNYRHRSLAVNVVGTGVLDCSDNATQSCYGSGYIEYDLRHTATNVPLIDHGGRATCFDFATATIRNGKALATERFLTLPLGSADAELVEQSAIRKTQFAGRPVSGAYRLRIKDSPALAWEKVEDVQIVLDYGFWSRVDRTN